MARNKTSVIAPRRQTDEDTDIVRHVLPTDMQQRSREVAIRHLQPVVDRPQRRAKTIAYARETAARRGVGLEHHEVLAELLCDSCAVEVRLDNLLTGSMAKIVCEDSLGILDGAEIAVRELGGAVLVGITVARKRHQQLRGADGDIRTAPWLQR